MRVCCTYVRTERCARTYSSTYTCSNNIIWVFSLPPARRESIAVRPVAQHVRLGETKTTKIQALWCNGVSLWRMSTTILASM
jgi:hypothetical protein